MDETAERIEAEPATDAAARRAAVLAFERGWVGAAAAKETAIRSQLGLSSARYYQLLRAAIADPEALREDPQLVRRLQRIATERQRARAARSFRVS